MENVKHRCQVEVCYSPSQYHLYGPENFEIIVVIDVLRATSGITTAPHCGVAQIIPLQTIEEAVDSRDRGIITAARGNGNNM